MTHDIHAHLDTLKIARCSKLSAKSEGQITYHILRNPTDQSLFIAIMGNEGGGYFSQEAVPLEKIEQAFRELQATGKPFPAIRLKGVFVGKSANNPSFMAAVLRHEGLLLPAAENPKLHLPSSDLQEWRGRIKLLPALSQSAMAPAAPVANTKPATAPAKAAKTKDKSAAKNKPVKDAVPDASTANVTTADVVTKVEDHENDPKS